MGKNMKKELQDYVWKKCGLPKEFKEEVKKQFRDGFNDDREAIGRLFGIDNLLSDAEGEGDEMLTVKASTVKDIYNSMNKAHPKENAWVVKQTLEALFGSKCLPDEAQSKQKDCDNPLADKEGCRWRNDGKCAFDSACYFEPLNPQEPKPAEPKFKVGDKVCIVDDLCHEQKYRGEITEIVYVDKSDPYATYKVDIYDDEYGGGLWYQESDLEPYTEPKKKHHVSVKEACEILGVDESEATTLVKSKLKPADCNKSDEGFPHDAQRCGTVYHRRKMDMAAMIAAGILAGSDFVANDCTKEAFDKLAEVSLACAESIISKTLKDGED